MTFAVKWLIIANAVMFIATLIYRPLIGYLGLRPEMVLEGLWIWQPVTYLFLHAGPFHILFNMLGIWMFGVELERRWGTHFFIKYYAVTGVGAGLTVIVAGLLPFAATAGTYYAVTIGASGALYGLLMAYALYYPDRPILMFLLFPIPAKYFVMIIGAIALFSSMQATGSGIAHTTHLGGLVAAYVYLKGSRMHLLSELQYRYLKWRINRMRRRFDVHQGGRKDVDRRVH